MTRVRSLKVKCGICGHDVESLFFYSVHYWEPFCLDGYNEETPGPDVCPNCGYVSYDITAPAPELKALVESKSYQNCEGLFNEQSQAETTHKHEDSIWEWNLQERYKWYCYYLISLAKGDKAESFKGLRNVMHSYVNKHFRNNIYYISSGYYYYLPQVYELLLEDFDEKSNRQCTTKLDYLRQLKRFEEASAFYTSLQKTQFSVHTVIDLVWIKTLIDSKDSNLYNNNHFGECEHKLNIWNEVIAIKPEEVYPYTRRANLYCENKQYDFALADFSKAIELDSKDYRRYVDRAKCYELMGEYELALLDYDRAIELDRFPFHEQMAKAALLEQMHTQK